MDNFAVSVHAYRYFHAQQSRGILKWLCAVTRLTDLGTKQRQNYKEEKKKLILQEKK